MGEILLYKSYLRMVKNSVGTKMFRNLYLSNHNRKFDATKNGNMSCAFFVSNLLLIWGLIETGHATVEGTIRDMEKNDWKKINPNHIKPGDIIVWEKNGNGHFHNGFYIGNKKAISNDTQRGVPQIHNWTYKNKRKIVAVYRHSKFQK